MWDLPNTSLILPETECMDFDLNLPDMHLGMFTGSTTLPISPYTRKIKHTVPKVLTNLKFLIKDLKHNNPNFPVYKTFRLLRQKCGARFKAIENTTSEQLNKNNADTSKNKTSKISSEVRSPLEEKKVKRKRGRPKKKKEIVDDNSEIINLDISDVTTSQNAEMLTANVSMWTEKYKPQSYEDIIGNRSSAEDLKTWLQSWVDYSLEQRTSVKKRKRLNSNSSDDFCINSDTGDTDTVPQNTVVLTGPHGSGKTSTIYALCNELNINVIEINASSKRPGKKILSELQEATKSHQVKNTDSASVGSFFCKLNTNSTEKSEEEHKKLTLLLVEDAEVVFEEQDDGFINALVTLITSSKRPIIITSADANCAHLQRFLSQHKVIIFSALPGNYLGIWLEILCLIEGLKVENEQLSQLLDLNRGDMRNTLLQLQFWILSGGDPLERKEKYFKSIFSIRKPLETNPSEAAVDYLDELSNLSWMCEEESQCSDLDEEKVHKSCVDCFLPYYEKDSDTFQLSFPINLGSIWCNLATLFDAKSGTNEKINSEQIGDQIRSESPILFSTQESDIKNANEINSKTTIDYGSKNKEVESESSILYCTQLPSAKHNDLRVMGDVLDSLALADVSYTKTELESDFAPCWDYWKVRPVDSLSLEENKSSYDTNDGTCLELTQWLVENNIKMYRDVTGCDLRNLNCVPPVSQER